MITPVFMPKIGLTMTEGKIVEWKKREGEWVEKGEVLFVFETEKMALEAEAQQSGFLNSILVQVDNRVPVGQAVCYLAEKEGEKIEIPKEKPKIIVEKIEERPIGVSATAAIGIRATPLARKMAKEKGLDLKNVQGSGMGGRIRSNDVVASLSRKGKAPEPAFAPCAEAGKLVKFTGMRRIVAQKMLASKIETAQTYMVSTIDAAKISEAREKLLPITEKKVGVRLTITDILMKITSLAIFLHPVVNTRWTPDGVLWLDVIHMGMAMALDEGLIVPVIWDIGKKSLYEIAKARAELVEKGRKGKLTPDDTKGSTFTLSSLGMFGVEEFTAIINQPESAILAVGAIIDKPGVIDKQIVIRPMMKITLSYDHRIIDGAKAAQFMKTLKELMEDPNVALA
jgi:pyruvate dehydrogenase E2 component (dihydrolipoamide acetyltransferase)